MGLGKLHRVMLLACVTLGLGAAFIIVAFTTPYWLVSDGTVEKFVRLGLWEACFKSFGDINYRFDRIFRGCKWIFDEDYNFLQNFLIPPFFVAVQTLFTLAFVLLILTCLLLMVFVLCVLADKEIIILRVLSGLSGSAGILGLIAVITFGALGDERNWMPDPDHNYLSWSFGCAVVGTLCELGAAVLFFVESYLAEQRKRDRNQQIFTMNQVSNNLKA